MELIQLNLLIYWHMVILQGKTEYLTLKTWLLDLCVEFFQEYRAGVFKNLGIITILINSKMFKK